MKFISTRMNADERGLRTINEDFLTIVSL
jgi:hypothetical protein